MDIPQIQVIVDGIVRAKVQIFKREFSHIYT